MQHQGRAADPSASASDAQVTATTRPTYQAGCSGKAASSLTRVSTCCGVPSRSTRVRSTGAPNSAGVPSDSPDGGSRVALRADRADQAARQRGTDRLALAEQQVVDEPADPIANCVTDRVARTGKYTLITCHPKRGTKGIDAAGVLGRFGGVAVHDAWAPYDTYADVEHQLCCAHAMRELAAVTDTAPADADWCWATQAADALVAVQKLVAEAIAAGADAIDPEVLDQQVRLYRSAVRIGASQTSARTSKVMRKHNALARRLRDRQHDYLRFTTDWRIPAGQQRLRTRHPHDQTPTEGVRLPPHPHRSPTVLRDPQLLLHRRAKHGRTFLDVLVMLAESRPWMPATS